MLTLLLLVSLQAPARGDWPAYGHDAGGARFSPLTQITRANVAKLQVAWTYHAGMLDMTGMRHRPPQLEVTPLVVDGLLYIITPVGWSLRSTPPPASSAGVTMRASIPTAAMATSRAAA